MNLIIVTLITLFITAISPARAEQNSAVEAAKQAYASKNYDAAIALVAPVLANEQARDPATTLTIALLFLRNAELHLALHRSALRIQLDFLTQLNQTQTVLQSKFTSLFLAEALFESGQREKAIKALKLFVAYPNLPTRQLAIANVMLKRVEKRDDDTMPSDEEAAILWLAGRTNQKPETLIEPLTELIQKLKSQPLPLSARTLANATHIYRSANQYNAALSLLTQSKTGMPAAVEKLDETRFLRFYDITLLRVLSELYRDIANSLFTQLRNDAKYKDTANFYLSESSLIFSDANFAKEALVVLPQLTLLSKSAKPLVETRLRAHEYTLGQGAKALKTWGDAVNNLGSDPAVSADAIQMCVYLDANCPFVVKAAEEFAARGRSDRFVPLWTVLGQYFLAKGNATKALELLETARDKTNSFSLDNNSPGLLISTADALRQQKQYPQALEIYFELARAFPAIRIIQEGLQGTYALENRGPGGVTIF